MRLVGWNGMDWNGLNVGGYSFGEIMGRRYILFGWIFMIFMIFVGISGMADIEVVGKKGVDGELVVKYLVAGGLGLLG